MKADRMSGKEDCLERNRELLQSSFMWKDSSSHSRDLQNLRSGITANSTLSCLLDRSFIL